MREYKKILFHFVKEHLLPLWRFRSTIHYLTEDIEKETRNENGKV
jgi:hypothetical protein